jgi:hypothetical protein
MAIIVQTHRGEVENANAYVDVALMKSYHAERGVDLSSYTDDRLSQALVLATDFLDSRYSFIGVPLRALQGTQCPRYLSTHNDNARFPQDYNTLEPAYLITTQQWAALTRACCQLAYRELKKPNGLMPDPTFDGTGQRVSKKTTKAGPVETSIEYAQGSAMDPLVPNYPAVDLLLRNVGLLRSRASGTIARA